MPRFGPNWPERWSIAVYTGLPREMEGLDVMRITIPAALALCLAASAPALAQPRPEYQRGEQLYEAKCTGCHNQQVHWRVNKLATDWSSLKFQVRRWQDNANLGWREDDVIAVSQYLNLRFYFYPVAPDKALFGRGPAVATGPGTAPPSLDRCSGATLAVGNGTPGVRLPERPLEGGQSGIIGAAHLAVHSGVSSRPTTRGALPC